MAIILPCAPHSGHEDFGIGALLTGAGAFGLRDNCFSACDGVGMSSKWLNFAKDVLQINATLPLVATLWALNQPIGGTLRGL